MGTYQHVYNPRKLDIIYIEPEPSCSSSDEEVQEKKNRYSKKLNKQYRNTIFQTEHKEFNNSTGAEQPYETPKLPKKHPWLPNRYQDMLIQWYLKCQKKNCACSQSDETLNKTHLMKQRVQGPEIPSEKLLLIDAQFDSYNETQINWPVQPTINDNYDCFSRVWKQSEKCCRQDVERIPRKVCHCFYPPPHKSNACSEDVQGHKNTSLPCYCNARKPRNESFSPQTCKMSTLQSEPSTLEVESETCSETIKGEPSRMNFPEGNIFTKCRFWQLVGVDGFPLPIGMLKSKKSKVEVWVRVELSDSDESITYQNDEDNASTALKRMKEAPEETNKQAPKFAVNIHLQDCSQDRDEKSEPTALETSVKKESPVDTSTKPVPPAETPPAETPKYSGETYRPLTRIILEPNDTRVILAPSYQPAPSRLSVNSVHYPPFKLPDYECSHYPLTPEAPISDEHTDSSTPLEKPPLVDSIFPVEEVVKEQPPELLPMKSFQHYSTLLKPTLVDEQSNDDQYSRLITTTSFTLPEEQTIKDNKSQPSTSKDQSNENNTLITEEQGTLSQKEMFIAMFGTPTLKPTNLSAEKAKVQTVPWDSQHTTESNKNASKHESYHKLELSQFDPYVKESPSAARSITSEPHPASWILSPTPSLAKHRSPSSFPPPDNASPFWNSLCKCQAQKGTHDDKKDNVLEPYSPLLYAPYPQQINITAVPPGSYPVHPRCNTQVNKHPSQICGDTPLCLQYTHKKISVNPPQNIRFGQSVSTNNNRTNCICMETNQSSQHFEIKGTKICQLYSTEEGNPSNAIKSESAPLLSLKVGICSSEESMLALPTAVQETIQSFKVQPPSNTYYQTCICRNPEFGLPHSIEKTAIRNASVKKCMTRSPTMTCNSENKPKLPSRTPMENNVRSSPSQPANNTCICNKQDPPHSVIDKPIQNFNDRTAPIHPPNNTCICNKLEPPHLVTDKPIQNFSDQTAPIHTLNKTCICNKPESTYLVMDKPIQNFSDRTPEMQSLNKTCVCNKPNPPHSVVDKPIQNSSVRTLQMQSPNKTCVCNKPDSPRLVVDKPTQNFSVRTPQMQSPNKTCVCTKPEPPHSVMEKPIQNFSDKTPGMQSLNKTSICTKQDSLRLVEDKPIQNFSDKTSEMQSLNKTCVCTKQDYPRLVVDKPIQNFSDRNPEMQSLNKTCACNKPDSPRLVVDKPIQNFSDKTSSTQPSRMYHKMCGCDKPRPPSSAVKKPIKTFSEIILRPRSPNFDDRLTVHKHIYLKSEKENQSSVIASTQTDNDFDSCVSTKVCCTQTSFIYATPLEKKHFSIEPFKLTKHGADSNTKIADNSLLEVETAKSSCKQTVSTKSFSWQTPNTKTESLITTTRSCDNLTCKSSTTKFRTIRNANYDTANVRVLETTELGITSSSTPLHNQVAIKLRVGTQPSPDIPECESLDFVQPYPHTCTLHETPDFQNVKTQTTSNKPVCICKSSKPEPSVNIVPAQEPFIIRTSQPQDANHANYNLISNMPTLKLTNNDPPLLIITNKQNLYYSAINFDDDEEEIFCESLSSSSQSVGHNKTESWIDTSLPSPSSIGEQFDELHTHNQSLPLTSDKEVENEKSFLQQETAPMDKTDDENIWEGMSRKSSAHHYAAVTSPKQTDASMRNLSNISLSMFQSKDPCFHERYPKIFTSQSPYNDSPVQIHGLKHVAEDPCFGETHMLAKVAHKPNVSETSHSVSSKATAIKPTESLPITTAENKERGFHENHVSSKHVRISSSPSVYYTYIPTRLSSSHELMNTVEDEKPLPVVVDSSRPSTHYTCIPTRPFSSHELTNIVEDTKPLPVVEDVMPREAINSSHSIYYAALPYKWASSSESVTSGASSETTSVRFKSACDVLGLSNLNPPENKIWKETTLMVSDQTNPSRNREDYPLSERTVEAEHDATSLPIKECKTEKSFNLPLHNQKDLKSEKEKPHKPNRNKK